MPVKRLLCPARVRRIPRQFSRVDQRLVRDEHIGLCGADALALYLFLVTVADARGPGYYSDRSIIRRLAFDPGRLSRARGELQRVGWIAYEPPLYQVLALEAPKRMPPPRPAPPRRTLPPAAGLSPCSVVPWEAAMIDYETFCRLRAYAQERKLTVAQIARQLGLHPKTVGKWLQAKSYRPRKATPRPGKLDPFKPQILRCLETHPYSATRLFQRIREAGYAGGFSIVKDYVRKVRPVRKVSLLDAVVRTRRMRAGGLGRIRFGERGLHPQAAELFRHGALLQPLDVRGVHRVSEDGAFSGLPSECFSLLRRGAEKSDGG